jgi:LacI family transcriptional regulator
MRVARGSRRGAAQPADPADQTTAAEPTNPAGGAGAELDAGTVTLYDVARLAGVSIATVSRVVHGQDLVRDSTRARVRDVIEQLGYVPDGAAQSLSRRRKDVVGLVCVERSIPKQYDVESMALLFYDEILRGVESSIRTKNRSLLITYLPEADPGLNRLLALSGKVDGLLIGEGIVPSPVLARLAQRLPVVVISGNPSERAADVVTADNRSGSAALITHLVEDHGLRRLYHVEGPATAPDAKERSLALAEVIDAHPGCELTGSSQGSFAVQSGEEAGEKLLALPAGGQAGRGGLRERPDGHRRAAGPGPRGRARARGHGRRRLRRHLSRQPVSPVADHRPPADAPARGAGLRPAPGSDRSPRPAAEGRAAAHRAGAALQLRLPARHRDPPAGAPARRPPLRPGPGHRRRHPARWPPRGPGRHDLGEPT